MRTRMSVADRYKTDPAGACREALRTTVRIPERGRIEAINAIMDGHGVEAIRGEWQNGYWCDIVATYVNFGDTYDLTIVHVRGCVNGAPGRFIVTSWGDWVERNQRKYSII